MGTKLLLAKGVAVLCYIIGGFGVLLAVVGLFSGAKNFNWNGCGQIFVILCVGLFFDLLSDIGWRVYHTTQPDKDDYDSLA